MSRFSLAISHTPWVPERVESMKRLQASLDGFAGDYEVFCDKEPNHIWSEKMWAWAAGTDAEWCVFLQDDAVVAPDFFTRLDVICYEAHKAKAVVVGLQSPHPCGVPLAAEHRRGYTTCDGVIGVGNAVKREALATFLEWRSHDLKPGAIEALTEDTLLGLWCAVNHQKIYHPLPTIVDHDTELSSTYGNDSHALRRSAVRWDTEVQLGDASYRDAPIIHMGRFYNATPVHASNWVEGITSSELAAIAADNGHREARRINFARKAAGHEAQAKVFIATPFRGGVAPQYALSIWRLIQDTEVDYQGSVELVDIQQWHEDVVRVRSLLVAHFLTKTDATHLLFLDSDIACSPRVIRGMLAADKDFVACPYPKRDSINFERVVAHPNENPLATAYEYTIQGLEELKVGPDACAEVRGIPLGCALLKREALQRLCDAHPELVFSDKFHNLDACALFALTLDAETHAMRSEDFSFCERFRAAGGQVWMYLGLDSPVHHCGEHIYKGDVSAFGLRHET